MKKIIITVVILIILITPRIVWQLKEKQEMDVLVIDKTVPNTEYREHKGLFWFLTNEKIVKPNGELYDIGIDYHGYDAYEGKAMEDLQFENEKDLIYIADTYGVYTDDLEKQVKGDRSEKLYGGLDFLEWSTILQFKGEDTTLVAEYNTFATPTEMETAKIVGESLSVNWTQWIGRYFSDLNSDEVPMWLITNYEKQYKKKWALVSDLCYDKKC